jgi:hypothetical protein
LKRTPCVVGCNWGWLRRDVVPEVAIIPEEQITGLSVVDGIGLDQADPSVAQRDVQTMASFHGDHSRVADLCLLLLLIAIEVSLSFYCFPGCQEHFWVDSPSSSTIPELCKEC